MSRRQCESASCSALYVAYQTESSASPLCDLRSSSAPLLDDYLGPVDTFVATEPVPDGADETV